MRVLVSGGTGFIGSHTVVELIKQGIEVTIFDNLYNSSDKVIDKIEKITSIRPDFYKADMLNVDELRPLFEKSKPPYDAVIHFAGLKAVGESVKYPGRYYRNNIVGTLNLVDLMKEYGTKNIIFSSSATVYGSPKEVPIREDFPLSTTNPYGSTKLMLETILSDYAAADPELSVTLLRYFNPIGAHRSGLIGEDPKGIPNNLMPYIVKVGMGELPCLGIFGNDYPTRDGTGVRDYIHVVDLAKGHVASLKRREKGVRAYNLGTGNGFSVLELVETFQRVNGIKINYEIKGRRDGDIAECYADSSRAFAELGWKAELGIEEMCRDSWNYAKVNSYNSL